MQNQARGARCIREVSGESNGGGARASRVRFPTGGESHGGEDMIHDAARGSKSRAAAHQGYWVVSSGRPEGSTLLKRFHFTQNPPAFLSKVERRRKPLS